MKKVFIPVFILMLFAVSCSMLSSTTQKYLNALNNTQIADTLESKTESKISFDLSKASDKAKKSLGNFKEIKFNADESIDNKNKKMETNNYISFGKYSWGTKMYIDGDQAFMKVNDKYAKLNPVGKGSYADRYSQFKKEYEEFSKELTTIWKETVQKEILAGEGNTIESTPDGDIKVTQLSLELNDEKAKNILDSLAGLLFKSEVMRNLAIENADKYAQIKDTSKESEEELVKNINDWFDKLPENVKDYKEKFSVENLKLTAKIDKDSYIIEEMFEGEILLKLEGKIRIKFNTRTTRWNINREVNVNIPEITEKDLIDEESIDDEMKETFEELFGE